MGKLKPQVQDKIKAVEELKRKIISAKSQVKQKEQAEKTAHIEAREKKEAMKIVGIAIPKVEAYEAAQKAVIDTAEPLVALEKDDLAKFATPAAVQSKVEKLHTEALVALEEARKACKEQMQVANDIKPPTRVSNAAKRDLQTMLGKLDQTKL